MCGRTVSLMSCCEGDKAPPTKKRARPEEEEHDKKKLKKHTVSWAYTSYSTNYPTGQVGFPFNVPPSLLNRIVKRWRLREAYNSTTNFAINTAWSITGLPCTDSYLVDMTSVVQPAPYIEEGSDCGLFGASTASASGVSQVQSQWFEADFRVPQFLYLNINFFPYSQGLLTRRLEPSGGSTLSLMTMEFEYEDD